MSTERGVNGRAVRKRYVIRSNSVQGAPVEDKIVEEARKRGYNAHSLFAIKLALDEALANAIRHGNKKDRNKRVYVTASITPRRAEIVIEDEGAGFSRPCVPNPRLRANLAKPTGRGILLMESYMNSVVWSCGGRRVKMVKINGMEAGGPKRR